MVILALQFFTQYFEYIPKASLAAVIISAILFMVEYDVIKPMWRAKSKFGMFTQTFTCLIIYCELAVPTTSSAWIVPLDSFFWVYFLVYFGFL